MADYSFQGNISDAPVLQLKDEISFVAASKIAEGTAVKISADNSVAAVAAVTDKPIGNVIITEERNGTYQCLVKTNFSCKTRGIASGALTAGGYVDAEAVDVTTGLMKYKAHALNNPIAGIVIVGGSDTDEVVIGILKTAIYLDVTP